MRIDWVPFSAAALVAGATALSVGSLLLPNGDGDSEMTLQLAQEEGGRWLAVAFLYFAASVAMTAGLPSILTIFDRKGARTGLAAVSVFGMGCIGIAGYAMLLGFVQALAAVDAISAEALDQAAKKPGLAVILYGWIGAFYLGELLLGIALLMAGTVPRWIPALLLVHVALLPVSSFLPPGLQAATTLLITISLCGLAIAANTANTHGFARLAY